jgi:hypothetical protein
VKTMSNTLSALLLGVGLAMIGGVAAATEDPYPKLPGEPPVQAATNGKLSEGDAINLAINWAKFGKDPSANAVIDTAITAITIGYPPAGIALGVLKGFFTALSAGPDPVAEALKIMDKRIAALEKNVTELAKALVQMNNKIMEVENRIRMNELLRRLDELGTLKGKLAVMREQNPTATEKAEFTKAVARIAARYRPDSEPDNDMWHWSDLRVKTDASGKLVGDRMPADFKTTPMLEAYGNALVLLMAAIQYENRDPAYVKATYSGELMRHVQVLSVRPYWLEGQPEVTLPERLMNRVSCEVNVGQKYPEKNGMCSAQYAYCNDSLARKTRVAGSGISDWHVDTANTLCTAVTNLATPTIRPGDRETLESLWEQRSDRAPWGSEALLRVRQYTGYVVPSEEVIEDFHGLEMMTMLADRVFKLASKGTLAEPPQYSFDHTYWDKEYLYGVKKNGELIWFGHLIGEDRNPKKENQFLKERLSTKLDSAASAYATTSEATAATKTRGLGDAGVIARTSPSTSISRMKTSPAASASTSVGSVLTEKRAERAAVVGAVVVAPPDFPIHHKWEGPKTVGSGWQNFRDIIPAAMSDITPTLGAASFYAVTTDGALLWYRHDGFVYGEPRWKGPIKVGSGWNAFKKIVPAGDGVLYGIGNDGTLRWYRQNDVADPSAQGPMGIGGTTRSSVGGVRQMITAAPSHFTGPNVVGTGWGHFVHVFSTGEGVVYAVDPQGKMWWYKHRGYLTGTQDWEGPKQVGTGWAGFKKVFSSSEGYIYALQPSGDLLWYQHLGYQDGAVKWRGPTNIGGTWGDYAFVFSAMAGTPRAPVVR